MTSNTALAERLEGAVLAWLCFWPDGFRLDPADYGGVDMSGEREVLEALARRTWEWNECPAGIDPDFWVHRWISLNRKLDAGAYVDAALMFKPEGWAINEVLEGRNGGWVVTLRENKTGPRRYETGRAGTFALALAAAIARTGDAT